MDEDKTDPVTLWSDTLLDMLCDALRRDASSSEVRRLMREIHAQGLKADKVLRHVQRELGDAGLKRVQRHFKTSRGASQAAAK